MSPQAAAGRSTVQVPAAPATMSMAEKVTPSAAYQTWGGLLGDAVVVRVTGVGTPGVICVGASALAST